MGHSNALRSRKDAGRLYRLKVPTGSGMPSKMRSISSALAPPPVMDAIEHSALAPKPRTLLVGPKQPVHGMLPLMHLALHPARVAGPRHGR